MARQFTLSAEPSVYLGRTTLTLRREGLVVLLLLAWLLHGIWIVSTATPAMTSEWMQLVNAGKAVRGGYSIYADPSHPSTISPILAVLAAPLASSEIPGWLLPLVCYLVNAVCIVLSVHWLTGLVDGACDEDRWWWHRVIPVAGVFAITGSDLVIGISIPLVLLLITRLGVSLARNNSFGAGVWLAAAASVQPSLFLFIVLPILRRDRVMTMGTVLGTILGMLVLPGLWFGLQGVNRVNVEYLKSIQQTMLDSSHFPVSEIICRALPEMIQHPGFAISLSLVIMIGLLLVPVSLVNWRKVVEKPDLLLVLGSMLSLISVCLPHTITLTAIMSLPAILGMMRGDTRYSDSVLSRGWIGGIVALVTVSFLLSSNWPIMKAAGALMVWSLSVILLTQRNRHSASAIGTVAPTAMMNKAA